MKTKILTSALLILAISSNAQNVITQNGIITEETYESKDYKGLNGVRIIAQDANPTESSPDGTFALSFDGTSYDVGKRVSFRGFYKSGYELLEKDFIQKQQHNLSSTENLEVVMVLSSKRRAEQDAIQNKLFDQRESSFKKEIADLKANLEKSQISQDEYQKKYQKLLDDYNNSWGIIENLAEEYSRINYRRIDSIQRTFVDLMRQGDYENAKRIMDSKGDIDLRTQDWKKDQATLLEKKNEIARADSLQKAKLNELFTDLKNYSSIAISNSQFDTAIYYLKQRALLDTTNCENVFEAANLLDKQNRMLEAESYYLIALRYLRSKSESDPECYLPSLAIILTNLGNLQSKLLRFADAQKTLSEALTIRRELAKKNQTEYLPRVEQSLNNLGLVYLHQSYFQEAKVYFDESLSITRQLIISNRNEILPDLIALLNNMANMHRKLSNFDESLKYYQEAIALSDELSAQKPEFIRNTYVSLNNYGSIQNFLGQPEEAEKSIRRSETIVRELHAKNPEAYLSDLSNILCNLALLQMDLKNYQESENYLMEVLRIERNLATTNPEVYLPNVANALYNLGNLQYYTGRYDASAKSYEEAVNIQQSLSEAFYPEFAQTLNNLGYIQYLQKQYDKANATYDEALKILLKLVAKSEAFRFDLALTLHNIANLQRTINQYEKAEKQYLEGMTIFKDLYAKNAKICQPFLCNILCDMSLNYIMFQKFSESEKYALEASQINPEQNTSKVYQICAFLSQGKYNKAEKIALEIKDLKDVDGRLFKEVILENLQTFEDKGIIPDKHKKDVEQMRLLLK